MINLNEMGMSEKNSPEENSLIFQKAVQGGGDIYLTEKGVYKLSEPIVIGDNTSIYFGEGVYIQREKCKAETGYVFVNRGAYTKSVNKNIKIDGLKLICNNVQSDISSVQSQKTIVGLRGHISFFCIKNLNITDCEILDLPPKDFGIHICNFENIAIENIRIEGLKDAIHLGSGNGFSIKHAIFKTFDDPIALNAHDYATSNPVLGWIENGIIEDCYDLDDDSTTGFFCRILAGSWRKWECGMEIQNSDSVVSDSVVYRAIMKPDGKVYKAVIQSKLIS